MEQDRVLLFEGETYYFFLILNNIPKKVVVRTRQSGEM
jgi:hypothetical protein